MNAFDFRTPWVFARDSRQIVALPIAARHFPGREVVILRDTAEGLWIGEWTPTTSSIISKTPVTLDEAIAAAEGVVCGVRDHGSVAVLTKTLALALLAINASATPPGMVPVYGTRPVAEAAS